MRTTPEPLTGGKIMISSFLCSSFNASMCGLVSKQPWLTGVRWYWWARSTSLTLNQLRMSADVGFRAPSCLYRFSNCVSTWIGRLRSGGMLNFWPTDKAFFCTLVRDIEERFDIFVKVSSEIGQRSFPEQKWGILRELLLSHLRHEFETEITKHYPTKQIEIVNHRHESVMCHTTYLKFPVKSHKVRLSKSSQIINTWLELSTTEGFKIRPGILTTCSAMSHKGHILLCFYHLTS